MAAKPQPFHQQSTVQEIAHDLNNHLGVVLGFAEVLLLNKSLDETARSHVQEIRTAAHRSRDLVRRLSGFPVTEPHKRRTP